MHQGVQERVDRRAGASGRPARALAVFAFSGHGFTVHNQIRLVPSDHARVFENPPVPLSYIEWRLRQAGYTDAVFILVRPSPIS